MQERAFLEDISALDTPKDAVEKGMTEDIYSNTNVLATSSSEPQVTNWRQRTRPKHKLRKNMKNILDSKFKKNTITIIKYSSSEEYIQIKNVEHTVAQTLKSIQKGLRSFPEILEEDDKEKGKKKVLEVGVGMISKSPNIDALEKKC